MKIYILTLLEVECEPRVQVLKTFKSFKAAQSMMFNYEQILNQNYIANLKYIQENYPDRITITKENDTIDIYDSASEYSSVLQVITSEI